MQSSRRHCSNLLGTLLAALALLATGLPALAQPAASQGQPPQFLSTHPGHADRIRKIEEALPRVLPLYEATRK